MDAKICSVCPDDCLFPSTYEIEYLLQEIDNYIIRKGELYVHFVYYGGDEMSFDLAQELSLYRENIERLSTQISGGYSSCICPADFFIYRDRVYRIIGTQKIDYNYQEKGEQNPVWVAENPGYVSFEYWEKAIIDVPIVLGFDVTKIIPVERKVLFDVLKQEGSVKKIEFDVLKVISREFSLNVDVSKLERDIKVSFNTIKKTSGNTMTFDTYKSLRKVGLTTPTIKNATDNGLSLTVTDEGLCVSTSSGKLTFNDLGEIVE